MLTKPNEKGYRYFIVRLTGKSGNIKADLSKGTDKFSSRNKRFYVLAEVE